MVSMVSENVHSYVGKTMGYGSKGAELKKTNVVLTGTHDGPRHGLIPFLNVLKIRLDKHLNYSLAVQGLRQIPSP